jgi:hypothetical protein
VRYGIRERLELIWTGRESEHMAREVYSANVFTVKLQFIVFIEGPEKERCSGSTEIE